MSRHRLYQNYDYEDELDDYDGQGNEEDEENELSPEDKKQMAEATAEALSVLGPQSDKVTTQQIQESLWHYYYDVDKTIAYLLNKYIDPPKKDTKLKPKSTPPVSNSKSSLVARLITHPFPFHANRCHRSRNKGDDFLRLLCRHALAEHSRGPENRLRQTTEDTRWTPGRLVSSAQNVQTPGSGRCQET